MKSMSLLLTGCFVGVVFASIFSSIEFDFSGEIQKARDLGIVSKTILAGYPKTKDIVTFVTVFLFPVVFSLGFWFLWAKNHKKQLQIFSHDGGSDGAVPRGIDWKILLFLLMIIYVVMSFNISRFYAPAWNGSTGPWVLLGEEGVHLAWMQSIFSGGVFGKDFYCLYGPMMVYPLAWFMKIFGATVVAERVWKYVLDLIAYGIIIFLLYKTVRWKFTFIASSIIYFFFFSPFYTLSLNTTYLRVALGILPLLLTYLYLDSGKKYLLGVTGLVVGQSVLFSQEVGICSLVSLMTVLTVHFLSTHSWKSLVKAALLVMAGCILSLAPMMIYLLLNGVIAPFIDNFFGYPKFIMLGYACLSFPSFQEFIAAPLGVSLFYYWPIFVYILSALYFAPSLLLGKVNKDHLLRLSLLIFGVLLFRVALGRSGLENILKVLPPAILLLFLIIDDSLTSIAAARFRFQKVAHVVLIGLLVLSSFTVVVRTGFLKDGFTYTARTLASMDTKWFVVNRGYQVPSVERGGIFYDPQTAHALVAIHDFLEANTNAGDYVYFFPNEAAYYFLFKRNNPTRFSFSYSAVTAAQRKELIDSLEKNRPKYVVYSRGTWRVDDIMEEVQVPEVVRYLQDNYSVYRDMGSVVIEKRVGT